MFRQKLAASMVAAVIGMALFGGTGNASANEGHGHDGGIGQAGSVGTSGKAICQVSGEEIDQKTAFTHPYKGKVYNLCCTDCLEKFKKNAEKYIGKAN